MKPSSKPVVLCFSGHDGSGGAGIQADIEAISSLGCHACSVVTALTVQNTQQVVSIHPTSKALMQQTLDNLLDDIQPSAIKIGLIGSIDALNIIINCAQQFPDIPLIVDPVLASGSGDTKMSSDQLTDKIVSELLPLCTLVTPNTPELYTLSGLDDKKLAAEKLNQLGCDYVFATGTHSESEDVHNELYFNQRLLDVVTVKRLTNHYHGSGCTLASAISAMLAFGLDPLHACKEATDFTFASLQSAYKIGQGQLIPNRLFWSEDE